jgi:hypothetical protein
MTWQPDPSDVAAIEALRAGYCHALDREDWTAFRSLFTRSPDFDPDAFVARVVRHHTDAEVVSVHQCFMPQITFTSDSAAEAAWAMEDYIDRIWRDDRTREAFKGYGHYIETYRKVDGSWKIASTRHERIRVDWLDPERLPPFPHRDQPGVTTARGAGRR